MLSSGIPKAQMQFAYKNTEYFRVCSKSDWLGMISLL